MAIEISTHAPIAPSHRASMYRRFSGYSNPEQCLVRFLPQLVGRLSLKDIAVASTDKSLQNRRIHDIEGYGLVPILPAFRSSDSTTITGHNIRLPRKIHLSYPSINGTPYLDTRQAIGLTYNDSLIAVAGIAVPSYKDPYSLQIRQLQDVTGIKKGDENYYRTGLQQGLDWKKTCIRACENIGFIIGSENIEIQSSTNSPWAHIRNRMGMNTYDNVAMSMGYEISDDSGNYCKPITDVLVEPQKHINLREHVSAIILAGYVTP
jgi:hypothetical protein